MMSIHRKAAGASDTGHDGTGERSENISAAELSLNGARSAVDQ